MKLAEGIAALELALPAGAEEKLAGYLALLAKWNRTYNLTAIRDPEEMVTHHLLDSLSVLQLIEKSALVGCNAPNGVRQDISLADVGSGAGLPGLVLAIARPDWKLTSIEAVEKKAAFQRQAKIELGLTNVSIHYARVEDVAETFTDTISRAFASVADFIRFAGHLSSRLWAMKGVYPADEVAMLPAGWRLAASHVLSVPGLGAERHLLQLERT